MTWPSSPRVIAWVAALVAATLIVLTFLAYEAFAPGTLLSRWRDRIEHARTHTILDRPMTFDGAVLPAGTEIAWADRTRGRVSGASLRQPAEVLGVPTRHLYRDGDGGWVIYALEPRELDGWPCAAGHTQMAATGRLLGCTLSRATSWQGWTLPEHTSVDPLPSIRAVRLTLRHATMLDRPLVSPVLGELPPLLVLNDDGSPSAAGYDRGAPHRVAGRELVGEVRWEYDPATYGMGRQRPPLRVSGYVHDPGGTGGADVRRHVVLPWPGSSTEGHGEAR